MGFLSERAAFAEACARPASSSSGCPPACFAVLATKWKLGRWRPPQTFPCWPVCGLLTSPRLSPSGRRWRPAPRSSSRGSRRRGRASGSSDPATTLKSPTTSWAEAGRGSADGAVYLSGMPSWYAHVEVQIAADAAGGVVHFGERDCSLQRRRQKLDRGGACARSCGGVRRYIRQAADPARCGGGYRNIGTFEFLVAGGRFARRGPFAFIEANPRLKSSMRSPRSSSGLDLVALQLQLGSRRHPRRIGLSESLGAPPGYRSRPG